MRSVLKATAMLGSVSLVNVATGLVSAKVSALLLGPVGMGQIALLQALLTMAGTVAALGISTGLIRFGAHALERRDMARFAALQRGAALALTASGVAIAAVMIGFRYPIAQFALGSDAHASEVLIMTAATGLVLAAGYHNGILNAHHRVADLARVGLATAILGPAASIGCIVAFRRDGVAWAVLAPTVIGFVAATYIRHRALGRKTLPPSAGHAGAAGELLRFGFPFTLSMLLGAGVLYMMPTLVLNRLGDVDVGYYRAGSTLAVTYLGFLLTTLQQDYNPRVSAVQDDPAALQRLINEQLRVILLVGAPVIFGMIAFAPLIVRVLFSNKFAPAVALLEWQLIGDIFKFASWTMSFVVLARLGSRAFLFTETFGGGMLFATTWLLTDLLGLEGVGIAFSMTSASYCLLCWLVLRRDFGLAWSRDNTLFFSAIVAGLACIVIASLTGPIWSRSVVAFCLAVASGLYSAWVFETELGMLPRLRARLGRIKEIRTFR